MIVAAGRGSRLGVGCKPLAVVGGRTLLERAVATARAAGVARVVVVVGSLDGAVASFCRERLPDLEIAVAPVATGRASSRGLPLPAAVVW